MKNKNIIINDNFLSLEDHSNIVKLFSRPNFPWYYNSYVVNSGEDNFHFCHMIFQSQDMTVSNIFDYECIRSLMRKINAKALIKMKANLTTRTENIIETPFHIDFPEDYGSTTGIYYLNSNNGYTFFEDGTKVNSVANRFVYFPVKLKHAGTNCTDEKTRCVININYF